MTAETKSLHDRVWEKEVDLIYAFAESIASFAGAYDRVWRLLARNESDWKKLFCCQIEYKLITSCKYQLKYIEALYKCLDNDLFKMFLKRINVTESFMDPLMLYVIETNFNENTAIEQWNAPSKMALGVIYKMNTNKKDNNDKEPGLQIDLVKVADRIGKELGGDWVKNRMRNIRKMRQSFESFNRTNLEVTMNYEAFIHDCDHCMPFDAEAVLMRRLKRTSLIFKLPNDDILNQMRPFVVNLCSPPAETDNAWLVDLTSLNNQMCHRKMSRRLCHDKRIVKEWSKLFILYEPTSESRPWSVIIQCLLAVLGTPPPLTLRHFAKEHEEWKQFDERSSWFVEMYRELYSDDLKVGILRLLDTQREKTDRMDDMRSAAVFLSLLQLHDVLNEDEHKEIIQSVVCRKLELAGSSPECDAGMKFVVALFQLTLSKNVCSELITSPLREKETWIENSYFALEVMNHCVFRFFEPGTPDNLFTAALLTAQVSQLFNPAEKSVLRIKTTTLLKKLLKDGHHTNAITEALKRLEPKTTPRKTKR